MKKESTTENDGALRVLHVAYKMLRADGETDATVDLPISAKRYAELARGGAGTQAAWRDIESALGNLTRLRGYTRLGAWGMELEARTELNTEGQ